MMKRTVFLIALCLLLCALILPGLGENAALPVIQISFPNDAILSVTDGADAKVSIGREDAFDAKLYLSGGHMDLAEIALPQKSLRIESENADFFLYNGGNDGMYTRLISQVCCDLIAGCPLPAAVRKQEPAEVYLNGEYAGLYMLREPIWEAAARFEGLTDTVSLSVADGSGAAVFGKGGFQDALRQLLNMDFSDAEALENAKTLFDTESFLNCLALNTYFGNSNFYGSFFFYQADGGPWKCAVGDLAYAFFSARDNSAGRIFSQQARQDLGKLAQALLLVPSLREAFLEKLGSLYRALPAPVMQAAVDEENGRIAAFLPSHMNRWAAEFSAALKNDFDYPPENAEDALLFQRYRVYRLRDKTLPTRPWYLYDSVRRELQVPDADMARFFGEEPELPKVPEDSWSEYRDNHP